VQPNLLAIDVIAAHCDGTDACGFCKSPPSCLRRRLLSAAAAYSGSLEGGSKPGYAFTNLIVPEQAQDP
jgi:hypothetical protein